ncbi:MAG: pyrimidine dimer DNA glycosylase/endonuclease V, partial [Gemmatimonadaceae bacterium]
HLDSVGLVALWREALLAQAVLLGRTRGYTRHPQLQRFHAAADPVASITSYLRSIADEATGRGYAFDSTRIVASDGPLDPIDETTGQLRYEWEHLGRKLQQRSPAWYHANVAEVQPTSHPLFRIVAGEVRAWERVIERASARGGA